MENKTITTPKRLSDLKDGDAAMVTAFSGGQGVRSKLIDLGIVPGERITVIQGASGHPFLVQVKESKVMLGWHMTEKIRIRLSEE